MWDSVPLQLCAAPWALCTVRGRECACVWIVAEGFAIAEKLCARAVVSIHLRTCKLEKQ